jgi:protein KRI1
VPLAD